MPVFKRIAAIVGECGRDALRASRDLYIVMVPVMIAVKILQELDLVRTLALPLEPLMRLVGLPADLGLAWAAALLNGVYSGLILMMQLAQDRPDPLTIAQVTTLSTMIVIAHALPVEAGIAHRCGARFFGQVLIRIGTALLFGVLYHGITHGLGMYQEAAAIPLPTPGADPSHLAWALREARNLISISAVIFVLLLTMRLLRASGALALITRAMEPVMRLIGIGPKAATITVIGMTLGLSYGSGVIIDDVRKGELSPEDVFFALSLMGICHSLVEDTLLMLIVGAELSGLLGLRVVLSLVVIAAMVRIVRRLPPGMTQRLLWVPRRAAA